VDQGVSRKEREGCQGDSSEAEMTSQFSVFAKNGMVVSSQPLATLAGMRVLMEGGNAIDAAAARGHQIVFGNPESFGGAHAITIHPESGAFVGGSDPRKGGCAIGL
jgi:gamma-glutamyltranspeptidase